MKNEKLKMKEEISQLHCVISLNEKSCFARAKQTLEIQFRESPERSGGLSTFIFHF